MARKVKGKPGEYEILEGNKEECFEMGQLTTFRIQPVARKK